MNANTIASALAVAGMPTNAQLTLTNPGGNSPWLFTLPATAVANAGQPACLEVPSVAANGVQVGPFSGVAESDSIWYADSNVFTVRAMGRVAPNATGKTLKIYLFAGNGEPAGSGALQDFEIGLISGVVTPTGGAYSNWFIEAKCIWDSASLQLTGYYSGNVAGTATAPTGFAVYNPSAWAAQQAAGAYNNLPFVLGANIASTVNPSADTVSLYEFSAELV